MVHSSPASRFRSARTSEVPSGLASLMQLGLQLQKQREGMRGGVEGETSQIRVRPARQGRQKHKSSSISSIHLSATFTHLSSSPNVNHMPGNAAAVPTHQWLNTAQCR